eukprot:3969315-Pyramimonas_sp.AAC.1
MEHPDSYPHHWPPAYLHTRRPAHDYPGFPEAFRSATSGHLKLDSVTPRPTHPHSRSDSPGRCGGILCIPSGDPPTRKLPAARF